jgi:hypothetical protein
MLCGLNELVTIAKDNGLAKNKLRSQRVLVHRSSVGLEEDVHIRSHLREPTLVLTSPPYPSIHVLYHRWQVAGRRETPAPYWFIGTNDGQGASYYTLGSRSRLGLDRYFRTLTDVFRSVRAVAHPEAVVVQLVSFADATEQLPAFLQAMELAGYRQFFPISVSHSELSRIVPNRQWYYRTDAARSAARELLLFFRPVHG